jgi:hypothetical protein
LHGVVLGPRRHPSDPGFVNQGVEKGPVAMTVHAEEHFGSHLLQQPCHGLRYRYLSHRRLLFLIRFLFPNVTRQCNISKSRLESGPVCVRAVHPENFVHSSSLLNRS